jgi:hypothetical protein
MWRAVWSALLLSAALAAQGTPPKADASKYDVQGAVGDLTVGADYLVHSIPAASGYVIADDYLIVEAAFFGPRLATVKLALTDFGLRITSTSNKVGPTTIEARPPTFAGSFAAPRRAPGDPNNRPPLPRPPTRVPTSIDNSGIEREAQLPLDQQVDRASLPAGEQKVPVSGALFFPFKGKTTSIKSLELIYTGPAGTLTLKFF